jgi:asparagine N-glycosylation enzyme membrane subunit Stt3
MPGAVRSVNFNGGIDSNWRVALQWLEKNSPEPMGNPNAWSNLSLRPRTGGFPYPPSAYGVLTWWDYGYQVNYLAHRIPNANGAQAHADTVAQFLATPSPTQAQSLLKRLGAKYVILDPTEVTSYWHAIVLWGGGDDAQYRKRVFAVWPGGKAIQLFIYLPDFYRSMAARLYIFDGKATLANLKFSVFVTHRARAADGTDYDVVVSVHDFQTQQQAWDYMSANPAENIILGSADPTVSCVELEDLPWAKRVFTSDETPLRARILPQAVKVFEVAARM